ncbi:MAG: hypothetical protein AAGG56_16570 [Pseudomonadota bacterium]
MYQTIQLSSCVSVHGEFVETLKNGEVIVRVGKSTYRGRPIGKTSKVVKPARFAADASSETAALGIVN